MKHLLDSLEWQIVTVWGAMCDAFIAPLLCCRAVWCGFTEEYLKALRYCHILGKVLTTMLIVPALLGVLLFVTACLLLASILGPVVMLVKGLFISHERW